MTKIAEACTDYVIRKGVIKEEERSVYEYGFVLMLETGWSVFLCLCIAFMMDMVLESVFFFIIFVPLRSYAGGLHLERYRNCLLLSCLTFLIILICAKIFQMPEYYGIGFTVLSEIFIYGMYPVDNVNRTVDEEENTYFRNKLKKFLMLDLLLVIICAMEGQDRYVLVITATFFMMVLTMILGKIKNKSVGLG